ncbi:hypothetical protein [Ascidiaceihabitans donghaensis]|nr:hypothetical protein [Ascidiaceihabitans donghaensis]
MMAFAGDHRKNFQVYHTRSVNQEFIEALDAAISSHQKAKETLQMLKVDEPAWVRANQEDVQAFEDLVMLLDEVRSRVAESTETNHGKLIQGMFGKTDPP